MHTNKIHLPDKEGDIGINYHRKLVQIKHIQAPLPASKESCTISNSQRYIIRDDYISTSVIRFLLNMHPISVVSQGNNKYHVIGNVRLYSLVKARINNENFKDNEKIPVLIIDLNDAVTQSTFSLVDPFTSALLYSYGKKPFDSVGSICSQIEHDNLEACFCKGIEGNTEVGSNNYLAKVFDVEEVTLGLTESCNETTENHNSEEVKLTEPNKIDLNDLHNESVEMLGDES